MFDLFADQLQDENAARQLLERLRWPTGAVCPHCEEGQSIYEINGQSVRPGLYKCGACLRQFSVTVGTLFEGSKIPLNKWLMAVYLVSGYPKGLSTRQLSDMLGISYKSAWQMADRLYEVMGDPVFEGRFSHIMKTKDRHTEADSHEDPGYVIRDGKILIKKKAPWEF